MELDLSINEDEIVTIIQDFIKTYVHNAGCKQVVLGLSGGIDSAVTAVLCQRALGKNNVLCLFLPEETTPQEDSTHQKLLVNTFKLQWKEVDITPVVNYTKSFFLEKPDKLALANSKTRIRMILLFEYANMTNSLVCGTSNKSELLIGYFTKYGDGGVDIMPLGDIYKTQVLMLAEFLHIPKAIITKPPTAGLWKGQTDEDELGVTYDTLDRILFGLEQKVPLKEIAKQANVQKQIVERIRQMRIASQHKRRSPLIPKVGIRTPGLDWRSPVQTG